MKREMRSEWGICGNEKWKSDGEPFLLGIGTAETRRVRATAPEAPKKEKLGSSLLRKEPPKPQNKVLSSPNAELRRKRKRKRKK